MVGMNIRERSAAEYSDKTYRTKSLINWKCWEKREKVGVKEDHHISDVSADDWQIEMVMIDMEHTIETDGKSGDGLE